MKQAKILFKIYTPNSECYNILENGDIQRTDMDHTPSGQWKFLGITHVKQSWFIPFSKITRELINELPMRYKNGNPQFTVKDLDHGTTRIWGNTPYHGIHSISFP